MRLCPAPFVVWFRERSGSTFLCSMLRSHPDIYCRYEDFNLFPFDERCRSSAAIEPIEFGRNHFFRRLQAFREIIKDPDDSQTITHLRKLMSLPRPACGFKFKFEIQVAAYPEIVDELHWISPVLRVLYLTRQNVLKQAVSRQNMERLQLSESSANTRRNDSLPPLQLDVERAIRYANYLNAQVKRFEKSVSRFHNVHRIVYEELQADPDRIMNEVMRFLNVDTDHTLSSNFNKATPDRLSAAVENFAELSDAVKGTEFAEMLD